MRSSASSHLVPEPETRTLADRLRDRGDALRLAVALLAAIAALADGEAARVVVVLGAFITLTVVVWRRVLGRWWRLHPPRRRLEDHHPLPTRRSVEPSADLDAKAHFLALASHEIRTPLAGILGLADLLGETDLSAEQSAYVRAVRTSGASLLRLVDGYLELTRLDAGHIEPAPRAVALETIVEDVVELLGPPCQAKGLELATSVSPTLPARVLVDPLLLRQVLINLAGNAVKFTERGGVAVEVERALGDGGDRVLFRVRDTGVGIDPGDADRIFQAWQRIEGDSVAPAGGTGLGLAIARGIVARLGGEIRLSSRLGEGATFSFELDLPAAAPPAPLLAPLAGRRIAVVSTAVVEPPLLVRRLHALGAEAILVATPADLAGEAVDAVLVDHRDDAGAAEGLAALRAAGVAAPAVVLVTPARRADLPVLREAGFVAHLVKPVRAGSLARIVGLAVGGAVEVAPPLALAPRPLDVLVVDDNEINALLSRAALAHMGHHVDLAADGTAALDRAAGAARDGRPYDAVLMDLHMPGLDGFSAIRALRAAEADFGRRPFVVALTADATPAAAERAQASGADATMVKPIDRDRLADLLAALPRPLATSLSA